MERSPPDGLLNASGALAGETAAAGGARGFSAAWTAVLAALMALLIVATVLGNALVMLAFVADSSLRTQNNFFLLNLAISDFLVGKAPRPRLPPEPRGAEPSRVSRAWSTDLGCLPQAHAPRGTLPGEGRPEPMGRWTRAKFLASRAAEPELGRGIPREGAGAAGRLARRKAQRQRVQRWFLRRRQTKAAADSGRAEGSGGGTWGRGGGGEMFKSVLGRGPWGRRG